MATLKKQKARKEYTCAKRGEAIKKGDEYYRFWLTRFSPMKILCLGCKPTRSQMTTSEFLSTMYGIEDDIAALSVEDMENAQDIVAGIINQLQELRDETEEKRENMPESLQDAPTGEMLQGRVDSVEDMISELEDVDTDIGAGISEEEKSDRLEEILEEIQGVSYNGE